MVFPITSLNNNQVFLSAESFTVQKQVQTLTRSSEFTTWNQTRPACQYKAARRNKKCQTIIDMTTDRILNVGVANVETNTTPILSNGQ